jgi:two-component system, chemotaxis family, sensor kinase CheA
VLGSGMLALILDAGAIGQRAEVGKQSDELMDEEVDDVPVTAAQTSFLIFEGGFDTRMPVRVAVPLDAVERIETVPLAAIESIGGRAMLQYRGELLAVEDHGGVLEHLAREGAQEVTLIICTGRKDGRGCATRFAMAVGRVVDVAAGDLIDEERQPGSTRLAVVSERLTAVHQAFAPVFELREVA